VATASPVAVRLEAPDALPAVRRVRPDWFELLLLGVFAAISMWLVALNLVYVHAHGLVWTGVDGMFPADQMGYLGWIQDASHHVLVSDLFVPGGTPHDYLQPMIAISGGLVALGVAPWLALLLWKPVAVGALFFAVRALCVRVLDGRWERRAALTLALLAAAWYRVNPDEWLPAISWGYVFALAAVASLIAALLCYEKARREDRIPWLAIGLGLLTSWLNPWQGENLILIVAGVELIGLRRSLASSGLLRRLAPPALLIIAAAVPLAYYAGLDHFDATWRLGHQVILGHWPLWKVLRPLVPLLALAALGYVRPPRGFLQTATMVWPAAILVSWGLNESGLGAWSLHSFTGVTIPLAVLSVQGVRNVGFARLPGYRLIGAAAVAALIVPPAVSMLRKHVPVYSNMLTASEHSALQYLASDPQPGVVLTTAGLGVDVPGVTGRRTYAANVWYWAVPRPAAKARARAAKRLFAGSQTGAAARAFVLSTGARFVLADCGSRTNLGRTLAPIIRAAKRFGCATVYEVS
jgi:hypothetical protein